ncbi:hypothetical protein JB92DRAFT_3109677 [Gautieria morchelliformis]|nr:hypothetical protein JB92DRAFT_3109677 [Gautieria morchelliformis]
MAAAAATPDSLLVEFKVGTIRLKSTLQEDVKGKTKELSNIKGSQCDDAFTSHTQLLGSSIPHSTSVFAPIALAVFGDRSLLFAPFTIATPWSTIDVFGPTW